MRAMPVVRLPARTALAEVADGASVNARRMVAELIELASGPAEVVPTRPASPARSEGPVVPTSRAKRLQPPRVGID